MATKQKTTVAKKKPAKAKTPAAARTKRMQSAKSTHRPKAVPAQTMRITWMVVCFTLLSLAFLGIAIWRRG